MSRNTLEVTQEQWSAGREEEAPPPVDPMVVGLQGSSQSGGEVLGCATRGPELDSLCCLLVEWLDTDHLTDLGASTLRYKLGETIIYCYLGVVRTKCQKMMPLSSWHTAW